MTPVQALADGSALRRERGFVSRSKLTLQAAMKSSAPARRPRLLRVADPRSGSQKANAQLSTSKVLLSAFDVERWKLNVERFFFPFTHSLYASIPTHVQTRLRSPKTVSMRATVDSGFRPSTKLAGRPSRVAPTIEHGVNDNTFTIDPVIEGVGKPLRQRTVIIVNDSVDAAVEGQGINVR